MKRYILTLLFIVLPTISYSADFLGVPILPNSQTVEKKDSRFEYKTGLSHDDVVSFYRKKLKSLHDIKYREWKDSTYIEDDGNRPWHSIMISKHGPGKETTVVITKDNWTWIIGTLVLRFVGVFIVLLVLYIAMSISGKLISRSLKKVETKS